MVVHRHGVPTAVVGRVFALRFAGRVDGAVIVKVRIKNKVGVDADLVGHVVLNRPGAGQRRSGYSAGATLQGGQTAQEAALAVVQYHPRAWRGVGAIVDHRHAQSRGRLPRLVYRQVGNGANVEGVGFGVAVGYVVGVVAVGAAAVGYDSGMCELISSQAAEFKKNGVVHIAKVFDNIVAYAATIECKNRILSAAGFVLIVEVAGPDIHRALHRVVISRKTRVGNTPYRRIQIRREGCSHAWS